jgi:hypothetical protein
MTPTCTTTLWAQKAAEGAERAKAAAQAQAQQAHATAGLGMYHNNRHNYTD